MVIASIDVQNSKVVQLKQGAELVLERDNPRELAGEFDRYGEVALIDLDAAMGKGNNLEMIKPLLRAAECRVGGGIRTPGQARELVSLGAAKIIVGSGAFRDPAKKGLGLGGGEFAVNAAFLGAMAKEIGRDRLIAAVDARRDAGGAYEIVVDGWKTATGLELIETAKAVEPYAGELLFTCVDREGTMSGIDLEIVKKLRGSVSCAITVAGGVSTLEEIEAIAGLGCDVQLGMALYTGKIALADAFIRSLNWKKITGPAGTPAGVRGAALIPLIAQSADGQVLMTGYASRESLDETFRRQNLCFHSRSRDRLWMKGETSGNTLKLKRLRADCDRDAILAVVEPAGPACHTGAWSCFGQNRRYTWEFLQSVIDERFRNPRPGSYTATLDDELAREKILEEAEELCTAKGRGEIIWEAADLLYFTTALLTRAGVAVQEVLDELDRRHKK
ncbi:MAG: phosphoribosyl-ATP diphosphatase [Spirochaetaceae bacterium]|jgi:phosphoribosyl-ATP pyrophosphohydrolase/phosphoribosyl-AMP cyclohydrolase|nr:phosphoribosyl-ATP diphosphatase [Spirochaetaceae bacterium]